ncbi:MAG: hypothetical protein JW782_00390 [Candidatus Saganbacteria bacterium]|nr:hypothetical protein [Candidatus Saganbacteria bacterium]
MSPNQPMTNLIGRLRLGVRTRISPRLTNTYARLGFANRSILAQNLSQNLAHLQVEEQSSLLNELVAQGVLKGRFRKQISSVGELEDFMLRTVNSARMASLNQGLQGIFPGTPEVLESLSIGIFQAQETALTGLLGSDAGRAGFNVALLLGASAAAAVGATLLGVPATYLLGSATVYSIISSVLVNRVDPHSLLGKTCKFGSMILPFTLTGSMLYGSLVTYNSGFMFIDAMQKHFGSLPLIGLGLGFAGTIAWTISDIIRGFSSNLGYKRPLSKKQIASTMIWSNLKIFSGINYMSYRVVLLAAFAIGAAAFHAATLPTLGLVGLGVGLGFRVGLPLLARKYPSLRRERLTERVANWYERQVNRINSRTVTLRRGTPQELAIRISASKASDESIIMKVNNGSKVFSYKGKTKQDLDKIIEEAESQLGANNCTDRVKRALRVVFKRAERLHYHPLDKMVIEFITGTVIKYGALLAATLPFAVDPLSMFFDLATVFAGSWTLFADLHSGQASITSAINWKRSMFNPEDSLISDADLRNTQGFCARMIAYMVEAQRNFSKMVNMLIMEYPNVEVELDGEGLPFANLGMVRQLRATREVHAYIDRWQHSLYLEIQQINQRLAQIDPRDQQQVRQVALELSQLLNSLGDRYSRLEHPQSFVRELRQQIAEDANRTDKWFDLANEESFVRTAYEAVRIRGFKFYEMARDFEQMAEQGAAEHPDLEFFVREMLGIFSVRHNHVQRKFDSLDDNYWTKTANLSWPETHMGDSLYQVWRLADKGNGQHDFKQNYVPSTYIRVNNPNYNHRAGNAPENQRFIWIRRETFLEVLGISQAMSNEFQYVDNTPANSAEVERTIELKTGHHELRVRGFFSNEEVLPSNHLIDWEGNVVPQSDLVWLPGHEAPPQFRERFRTWAMRHYGFTKPGDITPKLYFAISGNKKDPGLVEGGVIRRTNPTGQIAEYTFEANWQATEFYGKLSPEQQSALQALAAQPGPLTEKSLNQFLTDRLVAQGVLTSVGPEKYLFADGWENTRLFRNLEAAGKQDLLLKHLDYKAWVKQFGAEGLWFIDRPEVLVLAANDNYNVCDEAYIVINTERVLQAELNHTAKRDKIVRVVNYDLKTASFPNPDPARPIERVAEWWRQDSFIGIRYRTRDGQEYNIPYPENRMLFVNPGVWMDISYGLIKERDGVPYIEVYSKDNRKLGEVKTEWPHHMHPASEITTMQVKENEGAVEYPRIEFDMFSDRVGMATWLVADYGENYGTRPHERFRFSRLDFDAEAKQEFWPNFIRSARVSSDGKRVTFKTISTNCESFPFEKRWANIQAAEEAETLAVDTSGRIFIDPVNHTWSPVRDADHTQEVKGGGIVLVRNADGNETVLPLEQLPRSLHSLKELRKVVDTELVGDRLVVSKLRRKNPVKDTTEFIYSLRNGLIESNDSYKQLKWQLQKQDLTVRVSQQDGNYRLEIFDPAGNRVAIPLAAEDLIDNYGRGFLQSRQMGSTDDFYQRDDNNYQGTEEYRPRLVSMDGRIKLILTRVDKVTIKRKSSTAALFDHLSTVEPAKIMISQPTSAVKIRVGEQEKWVPLSLSKPITYNETQNNATVALKINGETRYIRMPLTKGLPPVTYYIKYDRDSGRFVAYTLKAEHNRETGGIAIAHTPIEEAVSPEVDRQIREALAQNGISNPALADEIRIDVFHTRPPEIIDGVYHSVVHGQRQQGVFYKDEAFPASEQAQFRDEYFYAITNELFSEAFPPDRDARSGGLQTGKERDHDQNDKPSGKPIENGTQFVGNHRHLFELAEVLMGIPKGGLIAHAMELNRSGGFEKIIHKPNFAKLTLYCREKGWMSGVSEDEQGVLSLALALGYQLKYHLRVTAFEAQPNTYGQVHGQDAQRYNTALALGQDVLMPYEAREMMKRLRGKSFAGTWKQKLEHFAFRLWYEWPKAELARQASPIVFLATNGRVKPYIVDPYFLFSWSFDFVVGLGMYSNMRAGLGRNKEATGHNRFWWSFIEGPAMNQAFFFQSHRGILELFRKGWQYGNFVITAEQKSEVQIPEENKNYLQHLIVAQGASVAFGIAMTLPGAIALGDWSHAFTKDYLFNEFWALYAMYINIRALNYIKRCELSHPNANSPEAKAFLAERLAAARRIDDASDAAGNRFFAAYDEFRAGNQDRAIEMWQELVAEDAPYKIMNYVLLSEQMLEDQGIDIRKLPRGRMTSRGKKLNFWGDWK